MSRSALGLSFLFAVTFGCTTEPLDERFDGEPTEVDQTGYVGFARLHVLPDDGGYHFSMTSGGATELYDFLSAAEEVTTGDTTLRRGKQVSCQKTGTKHLCGLRLAKDGTLLPLGDLPLTLDTAPEAEAGCSVWVHENPIDFGRIKISSDIAKRLQADLFPAVKKVGDEEWRGVLRCAIQRTGFGKSGNLLGRSSRCYVAFSPSGESLEKNALEHAAATKAR